TQAAVLVAPRSTLLVDPARRRAEPLRLRDRAVSVAAVVTAPFVLWDPPALWPSVVQFQLMQPLRMDAVSHLVWIHGRWPGFPLLLWIPFLVLVPTMAAVLWRDERSPARFAGALTVVGL